MKVTVGIPFRDSEKTLGLAIRSVLAQTYEDWELVLVDDGSTDRSVEIARSVSDPRVRVLVDGKSLNLSARLNQLAWEAQGEYLVRMDADDLMFPSRLATQVAFLDDNHDVDLVASSAVVIDGDDRAYGAWPLPAYEYSQALFMQNGVFIHPTVCARRDWFRANQFDVDLERAEDKELWARTHANSKFARLQEPLLFYRQMGTFRLNVYRMGCHCDRVIARRHGTNLIGIKKTQAHILKTYAKEALYCVASALGQEDRLIRRRSQPLDAADAQRYQSVIDEIKKQPVAR